MSSSHRPSGDVNVTNPPIDAPITEHDGASSTRNSEKASAVHTMRSHRAQKDTGQDAHTYIQKPQGKEGRNLHTKRNMVEEERKLDSGSNGEADGMDDVRDSTAQQTRDGKDKRVHDINHTRSESIRRSTRAKSQRNSSQENSCAMRRIEGRLCSNGCLCGNGLPLKAPVIMYKAQGQQGVGRERSGSGSRPPSLLSTSPPDGAHQPHSPGYA